jgi:Peptidase family M1 domain
MRAGVALLGLSYLLTPWFAAAAEKSPRELYEALNALRIDPAAIYPVQTADRLEIRRGDLKLSFDDGTLAFLASFDGRVTGAMFSGRGHALALPRGVVEKQQMARFLGAPVLDQDLTYVAMRFTDDTANELLRQLGHAQVHPRPEPDFSSRWNALLAAANPVHSLRIAFESLTQNPRPYFYASIGGVATGPFDAVLDFWRYEPFSLGQAKQSGDRTFYDVWVSYAIPGVLPPAPAFRALHYTVDTSVLGDTSLDAKTDVRLRAEATGERLLVFQLSRTLGVDSLTGDHGEPLIFFQNEGMNLQERNRHGNDYLYVVLPAASARGTEFTLHFHYHGNIIENAGNGVLFVGARESWYPHLGGAADFADYDLTMRWPRRLRLVATGIEIEEREERDFRVGRWRTERPVSVAGFNVGDYISTSMTSRGYSVDVFANRQLEQAIDNRLEEPSSKLPRTPSFGAEGRTNADMMRIDASTPRPADALKQLGREIDASIKYYETLSGPFPFQKLNVSQIPGTFGQGWPGLLYLSTYSYLPAEAQHRMGLSETAQEHFTELVPPHEVAHQWWGNVVGWNSYRDQWIDEAIANYLALLFVDTHKSSAHSLRIWLDRYRKHLTEKLSGSDESIGEIGALDLGSRLTCSKSPTGFEDVIYGKGAWVLHMIRELLRQPGAKNPDARFNGLLHTLATKYAYRALSTADLQREVEAVMTPAMDLEGGHSMEWFFEQWVRGTGIPHYRVEFSAHSSDKGYIVRGKLFQQEVPRSFVAPVPLYAVAAGGRPTLLGTVVAGGPETSFRFTTQAAPQKILIDPQVTLLCITQ